MSDPVATFKVIMQGGRELVVCAYGEFTGTARIFSAGMDEAQQRAMQQAKDKYKRANPS